MKFRDFERPPVLGVGDLPVSSLRFLSFDEVETCVLFCLELELANSEL